MKKFLIALLVVVLIVVAVVAVLRWKASQPAQDEAMAAGLTVEHFRQAADEPDYFREADGGIQLTPAEIRGRNTWWVWTGGNQAFWDYLANHSFGTFDLLKTASSFPCSDEQRAAAERHEASLHQASSDGAGDDEGHYGAGGSATPPGGYGQSYAEEGYQGACADTMYPAGGKAPYRYYDRDTRFCYTGLINEPGFQKASRPDSHGLCLDEATTAADPFDEEIYGRPSGIMGLRLFDNPNFDEEAQADWDPIKFYTDPQYFSNPKLVRPYRVGMSCGFCHISPHPLHPPEDPENPTFADMSGTIGAQYFWFGRVFGPNVEPDNFAWHLLGAQLPGAVDTSFVPADNINNPRAMNAIFDVPARMAAAGRFHPETMDGGALDLPEVAQHRNGDTSELGVPHILWDGADSVGIDAALTRVYINIGEYHQEWIKHIRPILGGKVQTPIRVKDAQENSVFWNATQERAGDMAAYLIRAGYPYRLADVDRGPGGSEGTAASEAEAVAAGDRGEEARQAAADRAVSGIAEDDASIEGVETAAGDPARRGAVLFAENCARCHSSKLPANLPGLDDGIACAGEGYLECWKRYWEHTETPQFQRAMTEMVLADDFLEDNYLSTDARVPVAQPLIDWKSPGPPSAEVAARYREGARRNGTRVTDTQIRYLENERRRALATGALQSELCSPMATNSLEGHVWDNFASRSYKSLPAVGEVEIYDPIRDTVFSWDAPGGGRGYTRVPTLIGIWSTAPYLHNNELGIFTGDPSVVGRLAAYDDAIRKLLWPELRPHHVSRTSRKTAIRASTAALPEVLHPLVSEGRFANFLRARLGLGGLVADGQVRIGPIPKGTPVNLLANLNLDRSDPRFDAKRLIRELKSLTGDLKRISNENLSDEEATAILTEHVPELLALSNCPDFINDRGHYFGTDLSDEDKEALIEYVKTL